MNSQYHMVGAAGPRIEVVVDYPPIFDSIASVFDLRGRRDIVFAWGNRIFNPHNAAIPPEILFHEAVHGQRQLEGPGIARWWQAYLNDPAFRLSEEVEAHRVEYRWLLEHANRPERRRALKRVAAKLASPLYGNLVSGKQARRLLEVGNDRTMRDLRKDRPG